MSSFQEDNTQSIDYWQVLRNHWGIILVTLILSVVTAFVITTLINPVYRAATTFIVNPDSLTIDTYRNQGGLLNKDQAFYGNQIIAMTSPEVMKVVDGVDHEGNPMRQFTQTMGQDYHKALIRLGGKVKVGMVGKGSTVFQVSVTDTNKSTAKKLANAVREGYAKHRLMSRQGERNSAYDKMVADYEKSKKKRDDLFDQLQESSRRSNLPYTCRQYGRS